VPITGRTADIRLENCGAFVALLRLCVILLFTPQTLKTIMRISVVEAVI
jgi:hypothetical protein